MHNFMAKAKSIMEKNEIDNPDYLCNNGKNKDGDKKMKKLMNANFNFTFSFTFFKSKDYLSLLNMVH